MDDPEILWWLLKTQRKVENALGASVGEALWDGLENRLFPEYDGDKVQMTDTGWLTPTGPINYVSRESAEMLEMLNKITE